LTADLDIDIPNRDAVHGDFGRHNGLFQHGRLSGVIDCEDIAAACG
jgi:Ser/Thr protein kinase RdoA (MazF antagonist)